MYYTAIINLGVLWLCKVAYKEMDNKMLDNGILTKDYISSQAEYKQRVKYVSDGLYKSKEILDDKEVLKLRQFKLDSLEYGKFFKKKFSWNFKRI